MQTTPVNHLHSIPTSSASHDIELTHTDTQAPGQSNEIVSQQGCEMQSQPRYTTPPRSAPSSSFQTTPPRARMATPPLSPRASPRGRVSQTTETRTGISMAVASSIPYNAGSQHPPPSPARCPNSFQTTAPKVSEVSGPPSDARFSTPPSSYPTPPADDYPMSDDSNASSSELDFGSASAVSPMSTSEPPVSTSGPPMSTSEPPVSTSETPTSTSTSEPPTSTSEPPTSTSEPPTPDPPISTLEPPISTSEPPISTPEPPISTSEPPISTSDPPISIRPTRSSAKRPPPESLPDDQPPIKRGRRSGHLPPPPDLPLPPDVMSTATVVAPPTVPPKWFENALLMFQDDSLGSEWSSLLHTWMKFEIEEEFKENGKLGTQDRPIYIGEWIQRRRSTTWRPVFNVAEVEIKFCKWWTSLQPPWRIAGGEIQRSLTEGNWSCLRKPGLNGLFSVLVALFYWGLAVREAPEDHARWVKAVVDVRVAISHISDSNERSGG
ncbi:hypothetical protein CVT26_014437 [Gymnopilus dilepis]|uniref:Uncharacterized protein n=1 Tax=Gymnopilus dilepis TaxID=231916 RepID=A0A409X8R0_9AGAR|nr:hypothetical protein CVT26_014437 [Gymnopilus dilepis]